MLGAAEVLHQCHLNPVECIGRTSAEVVSNTKLHRNARHVPRSTRARALSLCDGLTSRVHQASADRTTASNVDVRLGVERGCDLRVVFPLGVEA